MADTEVKASPSLGANEPPSPSPSTAPANPLPDAPSRANYTQPLPATSSAYRAIANLNRGFEHDRRNLAALQEFNFFPEEELIAWGNVLGRLQAEASLRLLESLEDRLVNNAFFYDRLCLQRELDHRDIGAPVHPIPSHAKPACAGDPVHQDIGKDKTPGVDAPGVCTDLNDLTKE